MAGTPEFNIAPRFHLIDLAFLGLLTGMVAAAWAAFSALGGDYFGFWQRSGALIALGTTALGWAWRSVDNHPGLISANPRIFTAAALQLAGLPLTAFGGHLRGPGPIPLFDRLMMVPAALVFTAAVLGWLLLIAPGQYFVFLIAGAPSRVARASTHRVFAFLGFDRRLQIAESRVSPPDPGWWDASMRDKPVSMAGVFAAAGFAVWNLIAGFL